MSFGYQILGFGSGGGVSPYTVQYLVVAGGGGGAGSHRGGAGGAGGFRTVATKSLEVIPGTAYPIQLGAGGTGTAESSPSPAKTAMICCNRT
jgi:hypothetical protein